MRARHTAAGCGKVDVVPQVLLASSLLARRSCALCSKPVLSNTIRKRGRAEHLTAASASPEDGTSSGSNRSREASRTAEAGQNAERWASARLMLENSTDLLPFAVVAAAALALIKPASYGWFTPSVYAPALGFLMFAVGVNLSASAFGEVFRHPEHILTGAVGQWLVKPALGLLTAAAVVPLISLPSAVGDGIILVSCVSGAQLSNYATFLVHPEQAPLSIVLTALSTAVGAILTPAFVLLLLGRRVPVNAPLMAISIFQVVILPVTAGLLCSKFLPRLVRLMKPIVVFASLLDTCACVGASLSSNAAAARSLMGLRVLIPVLFFHAAAFFTGHVLASQTIAKESLPLARCLSLETGMQSSLLALLLATRFFNNPLISLSCGISVIVMTLGGFGLVVLWKTGDQEHKAAEESMRAAVQ